MAAKKTFESVKRELIDASERQYGAEVREKYGDFAVDESNRKMMGLTEEQFARFQELGNQINAVIERAVADGIDPLGEEGARVCAMHREWLEFTWPQYLPEMHRGLADGYVADERFRAYYDARIEGCAQWLRDAIVAHA
ncbi:MAG: TipAS antibiotic-recognition domain-containing protein [Coriobacteriaceae bacterium]|nr:TipAS antibiotic-recognition domain-containing protein [Coriobacteriaceae bacterium]